MSVAMKWSDGRPQSVEDFLSDVLDEGCTPVAVDAAGNVLGFFICHLCRRDPKDQRPTLQDLVVAFPGAHTFARLIDVWCVSPLRSIMLIIASDRAVHQSLV